MLIELDPAQTVKYCWGLWEFSFWIINNFAKRITEHQTLQKNVKSTKICLLEAYANFYNNKKGPAKWKNYHASWIIHLEHINEMCLAMMSLHNSYIITSERWTDDSVGHFIPRACSTTQLDGCLSNCKLNSIPPLKPVMIHTLIMKNLSFQPLKKIQNGYPFSFKESPKAQNTPKHKIITSHPI